MKRKTSLIVALIAAALAGSIVSHAEAGTSRRGEWQTLQTGNKLSGQVYRQVPENPHALTGSFERVETPRTMRCGRDIRPIGNKLTTIGTTCTTR